MTVTQLVAASHVALHPAVMHHVAMRLAVTDPMRHAVTSPLTHHVATSPLVIASVLSLLAVMRLAVIVPLSHHVVIVRRPLAATILTPAHAAKVVLLSTVLTVHLPIVPLMLASLPHVLVAISRHAQQHPAVRLSRHAAMVLHVQAQQLGQALHALRLVRVGALILTVAAVKRLPSNGLRST